MHVSVVEGADLTMSHKRSQENLAKVNRRAAMLSLRVI